MAGTLSYNLRVSDLFNSRRRVPVDGGKAVTVAADLRSAGTMSPIATGQGSVLDVGTVTTLGYLWMRNDDATNFVTWGPDSAGNLVGCGKLMPGEEAWLRLLPGVTLRLKSDTGVCEVAFELWSA